MTVRRSTLCAFATAGSLLAPVAPHVAQAGTCPKVDVNLSSNVPRYAGSSDTAANLYPSRGECFQPEWIDTQDCKNDIRLQFTLSITGLPCADSIQVWAGTTDCL